MSDLWTEILNTSSLAAAVRELYAAVSTNRIATLQLLTDAGPLAPSVQIPFPSFVSVLPAEGAIEQQGIWLTTAHTIAKGGEGIDGNDAGAEEHDSMAKTFGLLLLGSDKKIIAELQTETDPTTMAMVEFVRLTAQPTITYVSLALSEPFHTLSPHLHYLYHPY